MSSKKFKQTRFLQLYPKMAGNVSQVCNIMGIHRMNYNLWLKDPEFKAKIDEIDEGIVDFAEGKLIQNIAKGDTTSIIFFLKTKGRKRGYIENLKIEHDVSGLTQESIINTQRGTMDKIYEIIIDEVGEDKAQPILEKLNNVFTNQIPNKVIEDKSDE